MASADLSAEGLSGALSSGSLEVRGRIVEASNITLLCTLRTADGCERDCVYKPVAGEAPLWDFPTGTLAARERAAYLVSEATGWAVVPPTVLRDGPYGPGMVQAWVEVDAAVDMVAEINGGRSDALRRVAVLDAVLNNADRKGGHLLPVRRGAHVHGVDHGVCFAAADKLRTVLWQWRATPLPDWAVQALHRVDAALAGALGGELESLLTGAEVTATRQRVQRLLASGRFPLPSPDWPAVPWPPW